MADTLDDILKKCYNYPYTVETLLCFISLVTWERTPYSYSFGRRMTTSAENQISPNSDVTPDSVIQLSDNIGLVVEIKTSMSRNQDHWRGDINQLLKYDDTLKGWWTDDESIPVHNVIVLIETTRWHEFYKYLFSLRDGGEIIFSDNICGTSFVRAQNTLFIENIIYEQRWGEIKDRELINKLTGGISIPIERVKSSYGNIKFYDSKPEIEYLLSVIWNDIFNPRRQNSTYNKEFRYYPIDINIRNLTDELQCSFGCIALRGDHSLTQNEREVEFPQLSWVREALDALVEYGMAKKNTNENYVVFYKLIKTDLLEYFAKRRLKEKKTKKKIITERQPMLFPED